MRVIGLAAAAAVLALGACGQGGDGEGGGSTAGGDAEAGAAPAAGATAAGEARIKPGLWRIQLGDPATGATETQENCVTEDEAKLDLDDMGMNQEGCTQSMTRQGAAIVMKGSCPAVGGQPPSTVEARVTMRGENEHTTVMTIGSGAQAASMTIKGTYVGPCPAGVD